MFLFGSDVVINTECEGICYRQKFQIMPDRHQEGIIKEFLPGEHEVFITITKTDFILKLFL